MEAFMEAGWTEVDPALRGWVRRLRALQNCGCTIEVTCTF